MLKQIISITSVLIFGICTSFSQSFIAPNAALKSHETLEIMKVVISEEKTDIFLKVENRISGGNFCADRKIYIIYPDGNRSLLISSNGIPVCPDTYKFKSPGEQLDFVLTFPPLKKGTGSFNLIEDCSENCFSFYGIILDPDLNKEINDAFALVENNEPAKAMVNFIRIAEEKVKKNAGADGLLYMNIVKLSKETGRTVKASAWYKKLESSGLPETAMYIKHLNSLGIKY
ncbi:MAG: hypothetical protein IPN67_01450 [Bacteroidales bacterium]|nr:hypothetical protein [Bacteroidales bacterium]